MTDYRLLPAGDTALTVEFGDRVDRQLSNLVLAFARCLTEAKIAGVVECVPTFRSLMVYYDPLLLPHSVLSVRIAKLMQGLRATEVAGRHWRLPVCYDESVAPDLGDVALRTNLAPAQVIERHSAVTYHVYMLGFLPGQPYLGDVANELALPRRQSPRMKIPAGSVGIAMSMTCIFPSETPCGWHLIGRCPVPLWDLRSGGAMPVLAPGDKVGFLPVSLREYEGLLAKAADGQLTVAPVRRHQGRSRMTPSLHVIAPGLLTTVQDRGRVGYQHLGVPVSGALDPVSLHAANLLVGNSPDAGALEVACIGPTLAVEADDVRIAVAGAKAAIDIFPNVDATSGRSVAGLQSIHLRRGEVLRIGALTGANVLYVAVEGGFDIAPGAGQRVDRYPCRYRRLARPFARRRRPASAPSGAGRTARRGLP